MKKLLILLFLSFPLYSQQINLVERVGDIISEVKSSYAPDKRTAIFNVSAEVKDETVILEGETALPNAHDELINKIESLNVEFEDNIEILPEEELGSDVFGVINLSVANIRSEPQHSAELVTQALLGTPVKVFKRKGGWYQIQTPDDYLGWVDNDGFERMDKKNLELWDNSDKIIVTETYAFCYSDDDENSGHVSDLVAGDILKSIEQGKDFFKIEFPDKRTGYVRTSDAKDYEQWLDELNITSENVIKTAKLFLGFPYLWGGASTKGMDCSGFTKTVYFLNGLLLPRDASQQVFIGEPVDVNLEEGYENLKPGDLLFFGRKATDSTKEKITHVGIYIGDSEFIHSSGKVKINSLDKTRDNFNEYRFRTFIRAKRILSCIDEKDVHSVKKVLFNK